MGDIKFEIKEGLGVISEDKNGWKKELNLISWNGRDAKYDIRSWGREREKMGKGIVLTNEEANELVRLLIAAGCGKE